jgi:hypothetical protein
MFLWKIKLLCSGHCSPQIKSISELKNKIELDRIEKEENKIGRYMMSRKK